MPAVAPDQKRMMAKKGLLCTSDAAAATGQHITTFYYWKRDGKITASRIGKHWFIDVESLCAFYAEKDVDSPVIANVREKLAEVAAS